MTITYSHHATNFSMPNRNITTSMIQLILEKLGKAPKQKFYILDKTNKIALVGRPARNGGVHIITVMDSCKKLNVYGNAIVKILS